MNTNTEKPKAEAPSEPSLIARIRMKVENGEREVSIGDRIVLLTDEHIYGFFELIDDKYPYMGIKSPLDSNPYNARDLSVVVAPLNEIAKDYLLEVGGLGMIDFNTHLILEQMDMANISLKEEDGPNRYDISSAGEIGRAHV